MKVALVSGASRGIGEAIARKLAKSGWNLMLIARNESDLENVAARIKSQNEVSVLTRSCDVTNADSISDVVKETESSLGAIGLCICNAGIGKFKDINSFTESDWEQQLDINAKGSFLLARECAKSMIARKYGQLIFITSDAAKRTFPNGSVYCASKFAQYGFASALRSELKHHNIRVTIVMPGLVSSYFNDGSPNDQDKAEWLKPDDVAEAVNYISSTPPYVVVDELTLHPISQDY